mmetsp:Transcript_7819/g.16554  ORF Transcript_7819/g.16554 Transcript_7819/m.16554 type:complete len:220 (+) Transcript_7819:361-1020(+)
MSSSQKGPKKNADSSKRDGSSKSILGAKPFAPECSIVWALYLMIAPMFAANPPTRRQSPSTPFARTPNTANFGNIPARFRKVILRIKGTTMPMRITATRGTARTNVASEDAKDPIALTGDPNVSSAKSIDLRASRTRTPRDGDARYAVAVIMMTAMAAWTTLPYTGKKSPSRKSSFTSRAPSSSFFHSRAKRELLALSLSSGARRRRVALIGPGRSCER